MNSWDDSVLLAEDPDPHFVARLRVELADGWRSPRDATDGAGPAGRRRPWWLAAGAAVGITAAVAGLEVTMNADGFATRGSETSTIATSGRGPSTSPPTTVPSTFDAPPATDRWVPADAPSEAAWPAGSEIVPGTTSPTFPDEAEATLADGRYHAESLGWPPDALTPMTLAVSPFVPCAGVPTYASAPECRPSRIVPDDSQVTTMMVALDDTVRVVLEGIGETDEGVVAVTKAANGTALVELSTALRDRYVADVEPWIANGRGEPLVAGDLSALDPLVIGDDLGWVRLPSGRYGFGLDGSPVIAVQWLATADDDGTPAPLPAQGMEMLHVTAVEVTAGRVTTLYVYAGPVS